MGKVRRQPGAAKLEEVALKNPNLINAFVAYFVMEWQHVTFDSQGLHGKDQTGRAKFIPDFVQMWGMDECLYQLNSAPRSRGSKDPGGLSFFLAACAYDDE